MLLGFKPQFAPKIIDGSKIHTVRNVPKRMPTVGEIMHMYTGLRTKNCELITKEYNLKAIQPMVIAIDLSHNITNFNVMVNNFILTDKQKEEFVVNDGFEDIECFVDFWTAGGKIEVVTRTMVIFHWTDFIYLPDTTKLSDAYFNYMLRGSDL